MSTRKILFAAHDGIYTAFVVSEPDGVDASAATQDETDRMAAEWGQRIERHDDGSCTIHDLPRPKTALELIEEWRPGFIDPANVARLDAIAEAIREGRAL